MPKSALFEPILPFNPFAERHSVIPTEQRLSHVRIGSGSTQGDQVQSRNIDEMPRRRSTEETFGGRRNKEDRRQQADSRNIDPQAVFASLSSIDPG